MNRRDFLKHVSVATAAVSSSSLVPGHAAAPNNRITLGLIGVGGRGSDLLGQIIALAPAHNVQIAAVCDVWKKNRTRAVETIKKRLGNEPRQFSRYGDLLAPPGIDAVVIATPDFSHGTILVDALKAGKDVYVEKPMTIDLPSANKALDLARSANRVVQVGTQRRSDGHFQAAARVVKSGVLGQISRVSAAMYFNEARWIRDVSDCLEPDVDWEAFLLNLEQRPFNAKLIRQWQLYRLTSNGLPGLWMTHYADAVHMVTGAAYPASAVALGGTYIWKDGREHTDTFHALLEYPDGFLFDWGMGLGNAVGVRFTVNGTQATLDLEKWTVTPERRRTEPEPVPAKPDQSHMGNWLECLRSRQKPNADSQYGHQHVVATVMSAVALQTGQRQKYNPQTRTLIAG